RPLSAVRTRLGQAGSGSDLGQRLDPLSHHLHRPQPRAGPGLLLGDQGRRRRLPGPLGVTSAAIYGCSGPVLTEAERAFFAETRPWGFILFRRNVESPDQVRALTAALRDSIGNPDAPILIDQEGGRV